MEIVSTLTKKVEKYISDDWMDPDIPENVFVFVREHVFDQTSTSLDPLTYWIIIPLDGDKRVYSQYDECVILFHECLFSLIGYRLPFNEFEVKNNLNKELPKLRE